MIERFGFLKIVTLTTPKQKEAKSFKWPTQLDTTYSYDYTAAGAL